MSKIFISYRREDTAGYAGRLYENLAGHFGPERVFMDIETLQPGLNFVDAINQEIGTCNALLVLIGPRWTTAQDNQGRRRLDDGNDFVRLEIGAALQRNVRVIPVLLQKAAMPREDEFPRSISNLAQLHAIELSDKRWEFDVQQLIAALEPLLQTPHVAEKPIGSLDEHGGSIAHPRRWMIPAVLVAGALAGFGVWFAVDQLGSEPPDRDRTPELPSVGPLPSAVSSAGETQVPLSPGPSAKLQPSPATQREPGIRAGSDEPLPPIDVVPEKPQGVETTSEHDVPPSAAEPAQEAVRKASPDPVAQLLREAERLVSESQLTLPPGENAYERYREVLRISPQHEGALAGLRAIAQRYRRLADRAIRDRAPEKAKTYLERALMVSPNTVSLDDLEARIAELEADLAREASFGVRLPRDPKTPPTPGANCRQNCDAAFDKCQRLVVDQGANSCLEERVARCEADFQTCREDGQNLFVMGPVATESHCAGIAEACRKRANEVCQTGARDCDTDLLRCRKDCAR